MLQRLDDLLFTAERVLVTALLMTITVMIFLDVVYRRLIAEETKLGGLIASTFDITDPAQVTMLHQKVAPIGYAVIGFLLLWFCTASAERELKRPLFGIQKRGALLVACGLFAAAVGVLWMMLHTRSTYVYILLFGAFAASYGRHLLKDKPNAWAAKLAVVVLVLPPLAWFAYTYFPSGYSWSKEMSLMLLMWVGFFGASICVHEGKHLFVEAVVSKLPPSYARVAIGIGFFVAFAFCGLMAVLGYNYTFDPEIGAVHLGGVLELTRLPDWISALPLPIAFGLAALRFLAASISQLTGGRYGQLAEAEGMAEAQKLAQEGATS